MQTRDDWSAALRRLRWGIPVLLALYLLAAPYFPGLPHLNGLLLLLVLVSGLAWQVPGGVVGAAGAVAARAGAGWLAGDGLASGFAGGEAVSLVAMGVVVGLMSHRQRELAYQTVELVRAQGRLEAIHDLAAAVGSTLDFSDALRVCHQRVRELFGMEYLAVLWRDEATGDLTIEWAEGYVVPPGSRMPRGTGISGWVAENNEPLSVGDVLADPRYVPGLAGSRSQASVPMRLQGQVVGVLTVESTRPNAFGPQELQLLTSIAEHAAAAFANARLHQQVRELAITDAATNLYNHRHFEAVLQAAVDERQEASVSLILFDLDHFKLINDTHGHPAGDAILKQVADEMRQACRQRDILCRYGGEEFAVILPSADAETAATVAERIRHRVTGTRFVLPDGTDLDRPVTLSAGIAVCPTDATHPVDLLIQADRALYSAKTEGRNRTRFPPGPHPPTAASSY